MKYLVIGVINYESELVAISLGEKILEFFWPSSCAICGRIVVMAEEAKICNECSGQITKIEPPFCMKCGRSVAEEAELCDHCEGRSFYFDRAGAMWPYSGKQIRSILDLKFNHRLENAKTIAILCAEDISEKALDADIDIIAPAPLHKKKLKHRGFNQAEAIAEVIGERLGLPVDGRLLERIKQTEPQMNLNFEQRIKNVEGSMRVAARASVAGKNLLLIDDIYTTGSTLNECAKALKRAGAKTINCHCACIALDTRHLQTPS